MGNIITSADFAPVASVVYLTQQTALPASNVVDFTEPNIGYRATGIATTEYIGLNFGAARALVALMIDHCTVTSVKVQYSTNGSTWVDSPGTVTLSQDRDGRYKAYVPLTSWNYQYIRVINNSAATIDGTSTFGVGSLIPIVSVTTWGYNPGFPLEVGHRKAVVTNDNFASGKRKPVVVGNRFVDLTLNQNAVMHSMESTINTILGSYAENMPFMLYLNRNSTAECYIVYRVGQVMWRLAGPHHWQLGTMLMSEVS